MLISMRLLKQVPSSHRQFRVLSQVPPGQRRLCSLHHPFGRQKMSLLLCLQKSKNADSRYVLSQYLHTAGKRKLQSAHRLNLRPCAWLLPTVRGLTPAQHQSLTTRHFHAEVVQTVFRHIAWAYRAFCSACARQFASHAPESKGFSPQRARGRERLLPFCLVVFNG